MLNFARSVSGRSIIRILLCVILIERSLKSSYAQHINQPEIVRTIETSKVANDKYGISYPPSERGCHNATANIIPATKTTALMKNKPTILCLQKPTQHSRVGKTT